MRDEHRFEFILYNHLRFSRCTHVRLEKAAKKVYRSWLRIRAAREGDRRHDLVRSLERAAAVSAPANPLPVQGSADDAFLTHILGPG